MIDINTDKDTIIRSLQELEFKFAQGDITEKVYNSQKRELQTELENFAVVDRIKRLQGSKGGEKPLEYWTEKKEAEEAKQAKEELMKKFITSSSAAYPAAKAKKTGFNKSKTALTGIVALIFFIGIGFGVFLMKVPAESAAVSMSINESAFPVINNTTNATNTTTDTTLEDLTDTTNTGTGTGTGGNDTDPDPGQV
jgi:hypothetical protein